jgi:hypothetical protein
LPSSPPALVPRPSASASGADRLRFPLLAGLTAGLLLGVPIPGARRALAADHGPLLGLGFLGTLIALERAAALRRWWAFLAPSASGPGAVALGPLLGYVR